MIFIVLMLVQSLSEQGAQAMRDGRFVDAERVYRQLLKEAPDDARLHMNLGLALHSGRKYREAIPRFERFLKANPQPGPAHLLLGVAQLKLQEPCEAIAPLEQARQWRAAGNVLVELGDAYFGCRRYEEAARTFEALGSTPKGLQGAGLSYARLGRQKEALAALAKLERLPPSAELHELLSEVRVIEGRNEDALKEMEAACKLAPGDSRLQRLRARALWRAGRYEEAQKAFNVLAPRWADEPEFNFERGDTVARLEGAKAGLPYLEKAVRVEPGLIPARAALGRALLELGRGAESVPHLEAAVSEDATLLLPLSRAYKATGRLEEAARAEAEYRKRLAPQN